MTFEARAPDGGLGRGAQSQPWGSNVLLPRVDHPFLIVTPPYARVSAGVTVLHLLCHHLNLLGETAYIVHHPPETAPVRSLPSYATLQLRRELPPAMLTPLITQDVLDFYDERRLTPIVIYPEVYDNPFDARLFGRYILNYPGKLNTKYQQREAFAVAYSRILADHCSLEYPDHPPVRDVLFVPTSDLSFWNTEGAAARRRGTCYYAGKLRTIHGIEPRNVPDGSIEIRRSQEMSQREVRELFWKSEAFYCYEDTALAIEAQLCGCPTVFVPTEFFTGKPLAAVELGSDGSCAAGEPGGLERARRGVGTFEETIRSTMALAPRRIAELVSTWKRFARERDYQGTIDYPYEPRLVLFDRPLPRDIGIKPNAPPPPPPPPPLYPARQPHPLVQTGGRVKSLVGETFHTGGLRGIAQRTAQGVRRHGPRGFVRLLLGLSARAGAD